MKKGLTMKSLITATLLFFIGSITFADQELVLNSDKGTVEFLAKGRPALLKIKGKGKGAYGKLKVKDNKASGQVELDISSFETGISLRDNHMKNKYLEVEKYPKALLTLKDLVLPKNLKGKISFSGLLKLHNVEKPVEGKLSFKGTKKNINTVKADFNIKISDFGIAIPSFKGVTVAEDVKISVTSLIQVNELKSDIDLAGLKK